MAVDGFQSVDRSQIKGLEPGFRPYTTDGVHRLGISMSIGGVSIQQWISTPGYYVLWSNGFIQKRMPYIIGSFMLAGPIREGSKIRFSLPPDFDVVDKVDSSVMLRDNEVAEVDAMLIFSCTGRLNCLGPLVNDEITGLIQTWKVPSIGFFTFGEFGRVKNGKPMFHGTTVSWLTLKEN